MPLPQNGWSTVVRKTESPSGTGVASAASLTLVSCAAESAGGGEPDGASSGKSVMGRRWRNPFADERAYGAFTTST